MIRKKADLYKCLTVELYNVNVVTISKRGRTGEQCLTDLPVDNVIKESHPWSILLRIGKEQVQVGNDQEMAQSQKF